jgi:hypothetical protein
MMILMWACGSASPAFRKIGGQANVRVANVLHYWRYLYVNIRVRFDLSSRSDAWQCLSTIDSDSSRI